MASLEELKRKLESRSGPERREAVHALGQMKTQRSQVLLLLQPRLLVDDYGEVIEEIVKVLRQLQALDPEVVSLLRQRLERGDNRWGLVGAIKALYHAGMTLEQISHILLRNPCFLRWNPHDWHHLAYREGIVGQVIEHTLRRCWWRLPRNTRQHFSRLWDCNVFWPDCPECNRMWRELFHRLERRGSRQEAEWLVAAMGRWWGNLRWRFGCHDLEELMSLRVEQHVTYEEVNTLRFQFLDAFATDRQERPIRAIRPQVRVFTHPEDYYRWDDLLRTEGEYDQIRDEISLLRRQQEEIIREAEQRMEGEWRWEQAEPPRLPEDLQGQWNEIAERLRGLEGSNVLEPHRRKLEEATEQFLPVLREAGICFAVMEVEGVLGEYNFLERKVTLYPPMIELAAADLAFTLRRSPNEVYDDLYTITEIHEMAQHATTHLGIDSNGTLWGQPEQGSSALHETLAQFYTFHLELISKPRIFSNR
jgi:hypothetical protein